MKYLALMAMIPLVTGPLPQGGRTLTMSLCDGAQITIPFDGNDQAPKRDCHQQACHAATCREKSSRRA